MCLRFSNKIWIIIKTISTIKFTPSQEGRNGKGQIEWIGKSRNREN
jgi:hypothetical protein